LPGRTIRFGGLLFRLFLLGSLLLGLLRLGCIGLNGGNAILTRLLGLLLLEFLFRWHGKIGPCNHDNKN